MIFFIKHLMIFRRSRKDIGFSYGFDEISFLFNLEMNAKMNARISFFLLFFCLLCGHVRFARSRICIKSFQNST